MPANDPKTCNAQTLAHLFGLEPAGINDLVRRGILPKPKAGRFQTGAAVAAYIASLKQAGRTTKAEALLAKASAGALFTPDEWKSLEALRGPGPKLQPRAKNKAELARLLGISRQALQHLAARPGFPKPDEAGRYNVAAALAFYLQTAAGSPGSVAEGTDLYAQRLRKVKEEADHLALKNAQRRGELVETKHVLRAWEAIIVNAKEKILNLRSKIESQYRPGLDRARMAKLIDGEVDQVLEELTKPVRLPGAGAVNKPGRPG